MVSTLVTLIAAAPMFSMAVGSLCLLVRLRKSYPIAGRGWLYLMAINSVSLVGIAFAALFAYQFRDRAVPCPAMFLSGLLLHPTATVVAVRGWLVVCRLEVMNVQIERQRKLLRLDGPELASVPGYFFFSHRTFTRRFAIVFMCSAFAWSALTFAVAAASAWLPTSIDAFLDAQPCHSTSVLLHATEPFYVIFILPMLVWVLWRLRVARLRRQTRGEKENDGDDDDGDETYAASDSQFVSREFHQGAALTTIFILTMVLVTHQQPAWIPFVNLLLHSILCGLFVTLAVCRAIIMSRRVGAAIAQSRTDKGCLLPHQRRYYSLRFILHNPDTFSVLLTFLHTEFSSENAQFYSAVQKLHAFCRDLERRMPNTWPQPGGAGASTVITINSPSTPTLSPSPSPFPSPLVPLRSIVVATATSNVSIKEARCAKDWCIGIYDEYIKKDSRQWLNLPGDLVSALDAQIACLSAHFHPELLGSPPPFAMSALFAASQQAIFKLIDKDSFRRFVLTKEFKKLLAEADRAHLYEIERGQTDLNARMQRALVHSSSEEPEFVVVVSRENNL